MEVTAGMAVVQEDTEEVEVTEGIIENDKSRPYFASIRSICCCVNLFDSFTRVFDWVSDNISNT